MAGQRNGPAGNGAELKTSRGGDSAQSNRLADAARAYAAHGWAVAPCKPRGKNPLVADWTEAASTDADTVAGWWRRWPDANVGVVTGSRSGLLVVDVDGAEGCDTLRDLQRRHGPLGRPLWQQTGSGGWHAVYRYTGELGNSARRLGPGLDTRVNGGQFLVAPSVHPSGGRYRWWRGGEPPEPPGWLLRLLAAPEPVRRPMPAQLPATDVLAPLVRYVASAEPGNRNAPLYWAACRAAEHVARGEVSVDRVERELFAAADASGHVAKDGAGQARATIKSGLRSAGVAA